MVQSFARNVDRFNMAKKLTPKERKYAVARIKGETQLKAYQEAGYAESTRNGDKVNAHKIEHRPHVQEAIERALQLHEATPEFAVGRLKAIAEQDKEIGASRLASKDILELHGWNKNERPNLQVNVKNAFFSASRKT